MTSRRYWFWLLGCLVVGLVLRLWQLSSASYWIDESYSIALAQAIVKQGWPITEAGWFITRSVFYHYLLAGVVWLGGDTNSFWLRLPAVLWGMGAIVAVAAVARQLFSQRVAIITAALMSFSVWEIAWSRQVRMYTALQCASWLTFYLYLRWRKQPSRKGFVWLVLGVFVTVAIHELGSVVVGLLLLHYLIESMLKQKPNWQYIVLYSFGLLAVLGCAAAAMHYVFGFALVNYWPNYWYYVITTIPGTGALVAIALATKQRQPPLATLWLASSIILTIGLFSFAIELLQYRYIFFILPAFFILSALALQGHWLRRSLGLGFVLLAIIFGEYTVWPKLQYPLESDSPNAPFAYKSITPQPDFKAAYAFIDSVAKPTDQVITPYPTIQDRYAPERTTGCLYIDLTGSAPQPPTGTERYTNCPYVTAQTLCRALRTGHNYILLDQFGRYRIEPKLRALILEHTKVVYTNTAGPWSQLDIYQPKASARTLDCHTLD